MGFSLGKSLGVASDVTSLLSGEKTSKRAINRSMKQVRKQTIKDIEQIRKTSRRAQATFLTRKAGTGISVSEGSFLDVTMSQAIETQQEVLNAIYGQDLKQSELRRKKKALKGKTLESLVNIGAGLLEKTMIGGSVVPQPQQQQQGKK